MNCQAKKDWLSLYTKEIEQIWCEEREELKSISMLYCALQNEITRMQNVLSFELNQIKSDIRQRDFLKKCKNFSGFAQSENFGADVGKENELPTNNVNKVPHSFPSPLKSEEFITESPNQSAIFETSPILSKNSLRKQSPPSLSALKFDRSPTRFTPKNEKAKPPLCDDSNILESTIIDDTPDMKSMKRNKFSWLQTRRRKKQKTSHNHTLTEMFLKPPKEKEINIDQSSMGITDILNLINESSSSSETDAGILSDDATVNGLDASKRNNSKPSLNSFAEKFDRLPEKVIDVPTANVVRGKERKKLLGWSCRECEQYYTALNLPSDELEKKKNECSRHRHKLKPKPETFDGFWDLTFGPSPKTQT